jgi:hypothetical protein
MPIAAPYRPEGVAASPSGPTRRLRLEMYAGAGQPAAAAGSTGTSTDWLTVGSIYGSSISRGRGEVARVGGLREDAVMTEQPPPQQPAESPVPGVVVVGQPAQQQPADQQSTESVASPAKVMRIGAMVRQLLEEVRHAPLDEAGRDRMREIYDISVRELSDSLSPDLAEELSRVARPFVGDETPSEAELRVAQAQLVGWLEGLFHGIQATLFAQQMTARNQLEEMRRRALPGRTAPDASGQYL